jgi:hypothetical protein
MTTIEFAYHRRSTIDRGPSGLAIALAPNLRRDRVSFDGQLGNPLKFREAISALHDVVISDLRYQPRDKTAYEAYKTAENSRMAAIHRAAYQAKKAEMKALRPEPMPVGLEAEFKRQRNKYWAARQQYSNYLMRHDPEMWRLLMPCDPVITVAPDCLFFECFSADESSYGCLTASREAFTKEHNTTLGTTNVDYSWSLYEHFQQLRSYRHTRFSIDPTGFDVQTEGTDGHREEKIDLPNSWLRGFMQLQSAMSLPQRKVSVSREGLYSILAFLKRHKAARSPRAVRFELQPGKPVAIILEPWERRIELHTTPYHGNRSETIRVWGRDRLRVLARLLPLVESTEVHLLGTGLPSFWVVRMGELQMVLGLSGWTTNDWTGASALQQLAPPGQINEVMLTEIAAAFKGNPALSFTQIQQAVALDPPRIAAGLNRLALLGQVIHDLPNHVYRWRQVMAVPLTDAQLGTGDTETIEGNLLLRQAKFSVSRDEITSSGLRLIAGTIAQRKLSDRPIELILDNDGRIVRGKCNCSHHFANGLRKGPCRHLQAMRNHLLQTAGADNLDTWFKSFWN